MPWLATATRRSVDLEDDGIDLGDVHSESVGGLVRSAWSGWPGRATTIDVGGRRIRVLSVDGNRVKRVLIEPAPLAR